MSWLQSLQLEPSLSQCLILFVIFGTEFESFISFGRECQIHGPLNRIFSVPLSTVCINFEVFLEIYLVVFQVQIFLVELCDVLYCFSLHIKQLSFNITTDTLKIFIFMTQFSTTDLMSAVLKFLQISSRVLSRTR